MKFKSVHWIQTIAAVLVLLSLTACDPSLFTDTDDDGYYSHHHHHIHSEVYSRPDINTTVYSTPGPSAQVITSRGSNVQTQIYSNPRH